MDYNRSKESADYINQRTSIRPQLGIICGSGQGKTFRSKMQKQYKLFTPALKWNEMVGAICDLPTYVTSDAIKIEPNTVVFYYCLWFDFHCIRRY